jgi:hypothetical protein
MLNEQRAIENNLARHEGRVELAITLQHMLLAGDKLDLDTINKLIKREEEERDYHRERWEKAYLYNE